jgi:hypothetical protein
MANDPIIDIKCQTKWYWHTNPDGTRMKIPEGFYVLFKRDGSESWETAVIESVEAISNIQQQ